MEPDLSDGRRWSRRQLLKAAGMAGLAVMGASLTDELLAGTTPRRTGASPDPSGSAVTSAAPDAATVQAGSAAVDPAVATPGDARIHYRSRPDLSAPVVAVTRANAAVAPGLIFLTPNNGTAPDGPLIVDDRGEPVWIHPESVHAAVNLRAATYRGEPVLTWWEGSIASGIGAGEFVIADRSYTEMARVRAANGYQADLHEFLISPQDTALFLVTNPVTTSVPAAAGSPAPGSPATREVIEAIVQEVDIVSGNVLFEWHSLPAIDPSESYLPLPTDSSAYDYLHANSIDIDADGDLLVSARHTWGVYKVDRGTGRVVWRLNGKRSDFAMEPGASFAWQHDARAHPDGTISIFDDGARGLPPEPETRSRGIVLAVDTSTQVAGLVREFVHPQGVLATSQGNFQLLADRHAFIGWGSAPRFSEFGPSGHLLLDGSFAAAKQSYRSWRFPWTGHPAEAPAMAAESTGPGAVTAYLSWNGATEVAGWDILAGALPTELQGVARAASQGFETVIPFESDALYALARALDAEGNELGRSGVIAIE